MDECTKENAQHVAYFYGWPGGIEAGGFTQSLLIAISRADPTNLYRLRRGFPGLVWAMKDAYQNEVTAIALRDDES